VGGLRLPGGVGIGKSISNCSSNRNCLNSPQRLSSFGQYSPFGMTLAARSYRRASQWRSPHAFRPGVNRLLPTEPLARRHTRSKRLAPAGRFAFGPNRLEFPGRLCTVLNPLGIWGLIIMRTIAVCFVTILAFIASAVAVRSADLYAPAPAHTRLYSTCKSVRVCSGLSCEWRHVCRSRCPDRYSCDSLYGAYAPHGGTAFWGAYTAGWASRW